MQDLISPYKYTAYVKGCICSNSHLACVLCTYFPSLSTANMFLPLGIARTKYERKEGAKGGEGGGEGGWTSTNLPPVTSLWLLCLVAHTRPFRQYLDHLSLSLVVLSSRILVPRLASLEYLLGSYKLCSVLEYLLGSYRLCLASVCLEETPTRWAFSHCYSKTNKAILDWYQ